MKSQQATENRLIRESSPYLLQHAHNPVDWYPWGDEAFELAKKQDKPIFLSIGYSTCHWCHVMAHESFEDEHIAQIMNEHFVNIKVDREERPDIDELYMSAVQAMSGSGGWPMSVFLTPQGKPFYGGTYFPPKDSFGRPSFERVLLAVSDSWKNNRREIVDSASSVTKVIMQPPVAEEVDVLGPGLLDEAFVHLEDAFDWEYGGFGASPKFPSPSYLNFALAYWWRTRNEKALQMVMKTADAFAAGGIRDHVGGGFHRYATDRHWIYPHFEKMLYDQAQIASVCLSLYQASGEDGYAQVAAEILDYVLRDMTSGLGGFYTAEDADSEGGEGAFYVWEAGEIESVLGKDADIFKDYYGVSEDGNFEGRNILHIKKSLREFAEGRRISRATAAEVLNRCKAKLLAKRAKRPRPLRDDKVITGWNGMMISAFAAAGAILGNETYTEAAKRAAAFIKNNMIRDGRLMRYYRDGRVVEKGYLEDYAFFGQACIDLYQATFRPEWLETGAGLIRTMCELFEDKENGGFFVSPKDAGELIVPVRPVYDGAVASGNSAAVMAILKLARLTMDASLTATAEKALKSFSRYLVEAPSSVTQMLFALNFAIGPAQEIVIAGDYESAAEMLEVLRREYLPNSVLVLHDGREIEAMIPFVSEQNELNNEPTAYICQNFTCKSPVTDVHEFKQVLERLSPAVHG